MCGYTFIFFAIFIKESTSVTSGFLPLTVKETLQKGVHLRGKDLLQDKFTTSEKGKTIVNGRVASPENKTIHLKRSVTSRDTIL